MPYSIENLNLDSLLKDVNNVIKSGVYKLLYDYTINNLTSELEKCRSEMEYYKNELENFKKINKNCENISLNIEDNLIIDNNNKHSVIENIIPPKTIKNFIILKDDDVVLDVDEKNINNSNEEGDEQTVSSLEEEEAEEEEVEEEEAEEEEAEEEEAEEEEAEEEEEVEEVEEEEAEEEEEEEEEEEVEEEEAEEEEVEEEEAEEEEEVFEIEIDDVTYFTNNEENGIIYDVDKDGNPGNKIGYLKDGEPFFY